MGRFRDLSYPSFTPVTLTTTAWTDIIAAVAGARIYVEDIYAANQGGSAVVLEFREEDGSAFTFEVGEDTTLGFFPDGWLLTTNKAFQGRLGAAGTVVISGFYMVERE